MAVASKFPFEYLWATLAPVVGTFLALPFRLSIELSGVALLYVLAVVGTATRYGRGPAVASAIAGSLLFAYVFVPPHVSPAIAETRYLISAIILLVVALIVGHITSRLKQHADLSARQSLQSKTLHAFSRDLSGTRTAQDVAEITRRLLAGAFGARHVRIIYPGDFAAPPPPATPSLVSRCIAGQALCRAVPEGGYGYVLLPLNASSGIQGVLNFDIPTATLDDHDTVEHIETIASVVSVALERSRLADIARETEVRHASERLRTAILGALSHDLRTPLAALVSLADTAALGKASPERQQHLLEAIRNQAMSVCQQMTNLLEMARLSSGRVELNRAWQPVEEVVGSALKLIRTQWQGREISLDIAPGLPPIFIDAVLVERVLWNLLENALKYSPSDTPVELSIQHIGEAMEIRVSDSGCGLPDGDVSQLFNAFQRGEAESEVTGVGLGLAISRTIIEAHEGTITAANRLGGGACFRVALPVGETPDLFMLD